MADKTPDYEKYFEADEPQNANAPSVKPYPPFSGTHNLGGER